MSYCRWSSDNMRSDVYAYEDCMGGYTIHVRKSRPINPEILPEWPTKAFEDRDVEAIQDWLGKKREAYPNLVYEDIGLEYDGETFGCNDLYDLRDSLVELKQIGYHVPESAFEMIQQEINT